MDHQQAFPPNYSEDFVEAFVQTVQDAAHVAFLRAAHSLITPSHEDSGQITDKPAIFCRPTLHQ